MKSALTLFRVLILLTGSSLLAANEVSDIINYREYSPQFSSSGQPTADQLKSVSEAGFKRVIYLAFSDNHTAIEAEDRVVKKLSMDYVHIPVDFENPTLEDFEDFAAVINRDSRLIRNDCYTQRFQPDFCSTEMVL